MLLFQSKDFNLFVQLRHFILKKTNKKAKSQVCKAKIYLGQEILRVFYLFVLEALKIKYFDLKLANMGKKI